MTTEQQLTLNNNYPHNCERCGYPWESDVASPNDAHVVNH